MNINLSDEQMRDLIAKTLLENIGPERQAEIMKGAIAFLLTPPAQSAYDRTKPPSPIEAAFQNAARLVAEQQARQALAEDTKFKAEIERLFEDVAKKLFADDIRDKIIEKICDAVVTGLRAT